MGGTREQWQRTLRRAYEIPGVVGEGVAMETLMKHLVVRHYPEDQLGINTPALVHVIIDQVLTAGAAGALDEALLPDSLRESISQPDWYAALISMVAGTIDHSG
jgi:hypothetical protein